MKTETVRESVMYMKEDVDALFDEIAKNGSWSEGQVARNVKEKLKTIPIFYMAVQRIQE